MESVGSVGHAATGNPEAELVIYAQKNTTSYGVTNGLPYNAKPRI